MLDQRGTGRSTPYGDPGTDPAADAERLTHFRADAIVRDAEGFREHLGVERWSVLGQSFGGFCSLHYLSVAPDSLREVFFTGGLPPVGRPVDESTRPPSTRCACSTSATTGSSRGRRPARALLDLCDAGEVRPPDGEPISRRLMRTIGSPLGMDGGAEAVHYLLERDPRSPAFAHDLAAMLPFDARNPLYAVIHESSYADGGATRWSAERVEPDDFRGDSHAAHRRAPVPVALRGLRRTCGRTARSPSILAEHEWPRLYDADVLAEVDVPCAAAIYADDPYVDRQFSRGDRRPAARHAPWLTDEYLHNGLRSDGERVLDRLIGLARGTL